MLELSTREIRVWLCGACFCKFPMKPYNAFDKPVRQPYIILMFLQVMYFWFICMHLASQLTEYEILFLADIHVRDKIRFYILIWKIYAFIFKFIRNIYLNLTDSHLHFLFIDIVKY